MRNIVSGLAVFLLFAIVGFILVNGRESAIDHSGRNPSGFVEISQELEKVATEIRDQKFFNPKSAATYIHGLADRAYALESSDFIPTSGVETEIFLEKADSLAEMVFSIRVNLGEQLRKFEDSGIWNDAQKMEAIDAFRRAHLYLSYAEDYIVDWRNHLRPLKNGSKFFSGEHPLLMTNGGGKTDGFIFKSGDVILVRGSSFFSATIARIGDVPSNMSHIAMVAETPSGELRVVEALLEKSFVSYSLDEYLSFERLPRAALYRFEDDTIAKNAGRELWRLFDENIRSPKPFDIQMNPDDHSKIYCAEAMLIAFAKASGGLVQIPRYRTQFSQAIKTDFAKGVGMKTNSTFAPADIIVDTRFTLVAQHLDLEMLKESRRFDVALSKIFEMFRDGFTYKADPSAAIEATLGLIARKFGFKKDIIPEGIQLTELMTFVRHRNLVTALMTEVESAEKVEISRHGRPLSYRELELLFDKVCGEACVNKKTNDFASLGSEKKCELAFRKNQ